MLLQSDQGGLELRDPHSKEFLHAAPEEGTLVLNIGDMLQRFTNGLCVSILCFIYCPGVHCSLFYTPSPHASMPHPFLRPPPYREDYLTYRMTDHLPPTNRLIHLGSAPGVSA